VRVNISSINRETAAEFGISLKALTGRSRFALYAIPRQAAMHLARTLNGDSFEMIGQWFDRDHSTVMSGCKQTRIRIAEDEEFAERMEHLADRLRPTIEDRRRVLSAMPAPSRKAMVMHWWEADEITADEAEAMIHENEAEAA
jgi:hypothetical protein